MNLIQRVLSLALTVSVLGSSAAAAGYGPFPAYEGPKLPHSAAVFSSIGTSAFADQASYNVGFFLDVDGDGRTDVADVALAVPRDLGVLGFRGVYVSPTDPSVYYAFVQVGATNQQFGVIALRRTGTAFSVVAPFRALPAEMAALAGFINTPAVRSFDSQWANIVAVRKLGGRGDAVLAVATRGRRGGSQFESKYAMFVDGPDADAFADHWTEAWGFANVEALTLDGRGNILARYIKSVSEPFVSPQFVTVRATGGDELAKTLDADSRTPYGVTSRLGAAYGPADVDLGSDRLWTLSYLGAANLDSRGRIIASSMRTANPLGSGSVIADPWDVHTAADGSLVSFGDDQPRGAAALLVSRDINFDGNFNDTTGASPRETLAAFYENEIPHPHITNSEAPPLQELALVNGHGQVRFRDLGEYPGGEAFAFRFGSQSHETITVSANGTVSFFLPVTGPASSEALSRLSGVIAPAWSDRWDTGQLRVHAGYAPAQKSFRTGERVLAFAVEWRGLRQPDWEAGRSFSMRLLLFSDGTWRTDYGAIGEVTGVPFVVGYAGPGRATTSAPLDASLHTWGDIPAGTGGERVMSEAFGATNDLGHLWVRWTGYPERLDAPGPTPVIINPRLVDGRKITMTASGSDIQPSAVLIVDGAETFALQMNAQGTKWVVSKNARSSPGARSVRTIWSDGRPHAIVVVNPDGERSAPAQLQ